MQRVISCLRRRNHYMDVLVPWDPTAAIYRLKWAPNFDQVFNGFLDAPPTGYLDVSISPKVVDVQNIGDRVRLIFDPTTFGIPDDAPFWIQFFTEPPGGPEVQVSAATLVLPDAQHHGYTDVFLSGVAPAAVDVATALQLDLPRLMRDVKVHNKSGATSLFLATSPTGPEFELQAPIATPQLQTFASPVGSLWVRGAGGPAAFSASFSQIVRW